MFVQRLLYIDWTVTRARIRYFSFFLFLSNQNLDDGIFDQSISIIYRKSSQKFVRFSYQEVYIGFLICKSHLKTRVRCRLRNRSLESINTQENKIFSGRILYKNQVEAFQTSNQLQLAFFFKFLVFFQGWTPIQKACFVPIWVIFKFNLPTYFNKTIYERALETFKFRMKIFEN